MEFRYFVSVLVLCACGIGAAGMSARPDIAGPEKRGLRAMEKKVEIGSVAAAPSNPRYGSRMMARGTRPSQAVEPSIESAVLTVPGVYAATEQKRSRNGAHLTFAR